MFPLKIHKYQSRLQERNMGVITVIHITHRLLFFFGGGGVGAFLHVICFAGSRQEINLHYFYSRCLKGLKQSIRFNIHPVCLKCATVSQCNY